jgi:arylsulfatase A-like enzyme
MVVAGCGRDVEGRRVEMPVAWLVRHHATADAIGVVHGADLVAGGERRRALASPDTLHVTANVVGTGAATSLHIADLPANVRAWGRAVIMRGSETATRRRVSGALLPLPAEGAAVVAMPTRESLPPTLELVLRAAVPIERFDVETDPIAIPTGAVLAFGVAPLPLPVADGPAEARIDVVDASGAHELWRQSARQEMTWQDVRVPLRAWEGRSVRFRFTTRPSSGAATGSVVVFGVPVLRAPRAAQPGPDRVVLISMDTLRAQSVGAYGCPRATTPAIDALAADGVLFENAYSTAAYTLPGHTSMVSGLWLRTHGVLGHGRPLAPEHRAISQVLQDAGWATGGFSSSSVWLRRDTGFTGYDAYVEEEPPFWRPPAPLPYPGFTRGLLWLAAQADRPAFAFLHNYQAHAPYLAPHFYDGCLGRRANDETIEDQHVRYEDEVRYADDQVRALLDALDWLGLRDRTLVVLTADHGEAFAEHGRVEHTYDVHDEVARVPLIMRLPGALPAGRRIAEPVSLVDVVPTILDVLGMTPAPDADGTSLLPLAEGSADRLPRLGVFTEAESEPLVGWTDVAAIHTRTNTCIHYARTDVYECYDDRVDPWQHLAPLDDATTAPGVAEARAALTRFVARPPAAAAPNFGLPPELRQQLHALGYVE